jgi:hypothetical protein
MSNLREIAPRTTNKIKELVDRANRELYSISFEPYMVVDSRMLQAVKDLSDAIELIRLELDLE